MTLDASTPEKLRDSIVASLREAQDGGKKGSDLWLAFEYFSDYLANARLVTPKTREVWVVRDQWERLSVLCYAEDVELHKQLGFSSIVRATLTLHEEV